MFLDNLSVSVLRLCDSLKLSYEAASELCNLSARYFGDIARGKTAPTILTLEKLCLGFNTTPNDLLVPTLASQSLTYQDPMAIPHIRCFHSSSGLTGFPVCPRCGITMEREFLTYCNNCGQRLSWANYHNAAIIFHKI